MRAAEAAQAIRDEVGKVIAGQQTVVDHLIVAVLANGHILLEGVPGVAKTLAVRSLAAALNLEFKRIQFTPDLMPSDVIGTNIFDPRTVEFVLRQGPIFTNFLLADEINRTPPKTQAALLESMEERHVTIDGVRHKLPDPFLVFATQNPIEFEGTYPLPEAQQDRFLMKVLVGYPEPHHEKQVLQNFNLGFRSQNLETAGITPVLDPAGLIAVRQEVDAVRVEDGIIDYVYQICASTRNAYEVLVGVSPRAGLALLICGKAMAAIRGRDFVIPDDVKALAPAILRHRMLLRSEIETRGTTVDDVIKDLIEALPIPR